MSLQRLLPWVIRAVWAVLPFSAGPTFGATLGPHSQPVEVVASVGLWAVWALVLAATLVPHPVSLTALRCATPAALVATLVAASDGHGSPLAVSTTAFALALAFLADTGMLFVNGQAYPNEKRFLLRAPAPLLLGLLGVAWGVALGPLTVAPLLLAARQWIAGAAVAIVGVPVSVVLFRAMHGLSRRWLVFVPAGVVLHDPIALADPVLFRRPLVVALGPAGAETAALDLTQTALGLALELALNEEVPMQRTKPGRRLGEAVSASNLLFTPTRPGAVLAEAEARGLPVR